MGECGIPWNDDFNSLKYKLIQNTAGIFKQFVKCTQFQENVDSCGKELNFKLYLV